MIRAVAGVAGLSVALVSSAPAPPGLVRLGEVLLFSATDLPADADANAIGQLLRKLAPEAARTRRRACICSGEIGEATKGSMRSSGRSTRCRDDAGFQISEVASRATSNTICWLPTRSERFLRSMSSAFTTRACDPIALKRSSGSSARQLHPAVGTSGPISESCITRPSRARRRWQLRGPLRADQGVARQILARRFGLRRAESRVQTGPGPDQRAQHISCRWLVSRGSEVCRGRLRKPPVGGFRARADGPSLTSVNQRLRHD